jgi:hypothetical protein
VEPARSPKSTAPTTRGVVAGTLILGSMLGGAGVLAAIGSLFGAFLGLVLGLVLVFRRFRDL